MSVIEDAQKTKTWLNVLGYSYVLMSLRLFALSIALYSVVGSVMVFIIFGLEGCLILAIVIISMRNAKHSRCKTISWVCLSIIEILFSLTVATGIMIAFNAILMEPSGDINYYWSSLYIIGAINLAFAIVSSVVQLISIYLFIKYAREDMRDFNSRAYTDDIFYSLEEEEFDNRIAREGKGKGEGEGEGYEYVDDEYEEDEGVKEKREKAQKEAALSPQAFVITNHGDIIWKKKKTSREWMLSNIISEEAVFRVIIFISIVYAICFIIGLVGLALATSPAPLDFGLHNCDEIDTSACLVPFPSNYYLVEDQSTPTGFRVKITPESMPKTKWGQIKPDSWNEADGFSTLAPIIFTLEKNVSEADLVNFNIIGQSTDKTRSTTVIINTQTGELVPHFVDVDKYRTDYGADGAPPFLIIQPAVPLNHATRYIVAVRNVHEEGSDSAFVTPSRLFKAFRDKDIVTEQNKARQTYFEEKIFKVLTDNNIERSELQLAWDFTTISRLNSLGRLEYMRDDAEKWWKEKSNRVWSIDQIWDFNCKKATVTIGKTLWGHFEAPSYLLQPGPSTQSFLMKDYSNMVGGRPAPMRNGNVTERVKFVVRIPCSVLSGEHEVSHIVQFGHGLFQSREEIQEDAFGDMANQNHWLLVATDWAGMCKFDLLTTLRAFLLNASDLKMLPERLMQGFINKMLTAKLVKDELINSPYLTDKVKKLPLITRETEVSFYGNSQGAVVGGGYFLFNKDLNKATLSVPGTPFALLLSRSLDFGGYYSIFTLQFFNAKDIRVIITAVQHLLDPSESAGWMSSIYNGMPSDYPEKRAVLYPAVGDGQVTTIGAHIVARSFRAVSAGPSVRPIYGVTEFNGTLTAGSGILEWQFLDSLSPSDVSKSVANCPLPDKTDTHECPHRLQEQFLMMKSFFEMGRITNECKTWEHGDRCIRDQCLHEPQYWREEYLRDDQ